MFIRTVNYYINLFIKYQSEKKKELSKLKIHLIQIVFLNMSLR